MSVRHYISYSFRLSPTYHTYMSKTDRLHLDVDATRLIPSRRVVDADFAIADGRHNVTVARTRRSIRGENAKSHPVVAIKYLRTDVTLLAEYITRVHTVNIHIYYTHIRKCVLWRRLRVRECFSRTVVRVWRVVLILLFSAAPRRAVCEIEFWKRSNANGSLLRRPARVLAVNTDRECVRMCVCVCE